jgi:hypothetical protein
MSGYNAFFQEYIGVKSKERKIPAGEDPYTAGFIGNPLVEAQMRELGLTKKMRRNDIVAKAYDGPQEYMKTMNKSLEEIAKEVLSKRGDAFYEAVNIHLMSNEDAEKYAKAESIKEYKRLKQIHNISFPKEVTNALLSKISFKRD